LSKALKIDSTITHALLTHKSINFSNIKIAISPETMAILNYQSTTDPEKLQKIRSQKQHSWLGEQDF
jgi:hypothetical protein